MAKKRKSRKKNRGIVLIKKSNQLIESRYKFDVWETRVFLTVLSNIHKSDEDFKTYRVWYRDIIKTFNINSGQSYSLLREAAKSLMTKVFKVSNTEEGFQRETEYHIIRSVNYLAEGENKKGKESQEYIDITVEPEMKPLLLQLQKNFTAYDLRNVTRLGPYAIRFYELLKQYEGFIKGEGHGIAERVFEFEEMKNMFELTTEYPRFSNFYQKIIAPSVRDINRFTDLEVLDVEKIKKGRRIHAVCFRFRKRSAEEQQGRGEQLTLKGMMPDAETVTLKDQLFMEFQDVVVKKMGVTPTSFLTLLNDCSREDLEQAIRVTRRAKANGQIQRNMAGFFVNALKNRYTDQKEEAEKRKAEREKVLKKIEALQAEQSARLNERIKELTTESPKLTLSVIGELRKNILTKDGIEAKELLLGRALEIEDFRQDRELREMVKKAIYQLHKDRFQDIIDMYSQQFEDLKKLLKN